MNINMNLWSVETAELERIQREGNSSGKDYIFPVIGMVFSDSKDGIFQNFKNFGFGLTSQFQDRAPLWPLKVIIVFIHCYEYSVRTYLAKH